MARDAFDWKEFLCKKVRDISIYDVLDVETGSGFLNQTVLS